MSVNDFVVKAAATALQYVPQMNLNVSGEDFEVSVQHITFFWNMIDRVPLSSLILRININKSPFIGKLRFTGLNVLFNI